MRDDVCTQDRKPKDYIEEWQRDGAIEFDGTKNKNGTKRTSLSVQIEEEDVIALFAALVNKGYFERQSRLNRRLRHILRAWPIDKSKSKKVWLENLESVHGILYQETGGGNEKH